jgi:3-deoxy-D-manno-octulosonic-acid transferase
MNVRYLGNVKFLNLNPLYSPKNQNIINFCNSEKPILTVASTHEGEDEKIIAALQKLDNKYQIIYAPRHPHRADDISHILAKHGILHQKLSEYTGNCNCILTDSIGSLIDALFYSNIAIYGGSFLPHLAGHNVLEAGIFKSKIIVGHYVEAFEEIILDIKTHNGIIQTDADLIYEAILEAEKNETMGENIYNYILQNKPNVEEIYKLLGV